MLANTGLRRICVFGAGAIGGHLAAIQTNGVALREGARADSRTIAGRVRANDRTSCLGAQDMVFVTTKATALGSFAAASAALVDAGTAFVFVQNGIPWWYAQGLDGEARAGRPRPPDPSRLDPGGALARAIAPERVIGAVVYSSNDLAAPGVVVNHTAGRNMLVVGEPDDRASGRVAALRAPPACRRRRSKRCTP